MAEEVAGAVIPLGLPGVVVQVVAGLAHPLTVFRDQQIQEVAGAADPLAVQAARAL